jgi:hypothetical protein
MAIVAVIMAAQQNKINKTHHFRGIGVQYRASHSTHRSRATRRCG